MAKRVNQKSPMFVSLVETLSYVMYDRFDFSGFDVSDTEVYSAVAQQGEGALARHWRGERDAKREIFRALRDGELIGSGRFSNTKAIGSASELDWRKYVWTNHTINLKEISSDFWSEDGIIWSQCAARNPGGEFADITFTASEVMAIWRPEDANAATQADVPASDRIVSLNHNSAPYREAVESLDNAIEVVRSANDLGTASADQRDAVVAELSAVKRLIEASKVRVSQVLNLAAPAFEFIAKTFTQEGIKRAVATAWDLLKNLLD
jgi:hypothetical protein